MLSWLRHDVLLRDFILDLKICSISALRIGAGKGGVETVSDLPVIRVRRFGTLQPFIPGSSLKGLLRSVCEYIGKTLLGIDKVCQLGIHGQNISDVFDTYLKEDIYDECLKLAEEKLCIVCKVFGTTISASHVYVEDAYPVSQVPIEMRIGVAIDRQTGAAAHGALYNYEYVSPNSEFSTRILCKNLPNYALGLILEAINLINHGLFHLGSFKSRGLGRVEFRINKVSITQVENYQIRHYEIIDKANTNITLKKLDDYDIDIDIKEGDTLDNIITKLRNSWYEYVRRVKGS